MKVKYFQTLRFYFDDSFIAEVDENGFNLKEDAKSLFGNRISYSVSGFNYKFSIDNLRINDSMILIIDLAYFEKEDCFSTAKIPITVNRLIFF